MSILKNAYTSYKSFVERVHSARIPLTPKQLRIAQIVYFITPIIGGIAIMNYAFSIEEKNRSAWLDEYNKKSLPHAAPTNIHIPTHKEAMTALLAKQNKEEENIVERNLTTSPYDWSGRKVTHHDQQQTTQSQHN